MVLSVKLGPKGWKGKGDPCGESGSASNQCGIRCGHIEPFIHLTRL